MISYTNLERFCIENDVALTLKEEASVANESQQGTPISIHSGYGDITENVEAIVQSWLDEN